MSKKRLHDKQLLAVEIISTPKRGGMTYLQVAEEVGVDESTLHRWRKRDDFYDAVNKAVIRKSQDRLAEMFEAAIDGVIDDKNAALFRTIIQTHGLLTEKVEVSDGKGNEDIDDMKERIASMRKGRESDDNQDE